MALTAVRVEDLPLPAARATLGGAILAANGCWVTEVGDEPSLPSVLLGYRAPFEAGIALKLRDGRAAVGSVRELRRGDAVELLALVTPLPEPQLTSEDSLPGLDAVPMGLAVLCPGRGLLYINQRALDVLGCTDRTDALEAIQSLKEDSEGGHSLWVDALAGGASAGKAVVQTDRTGDLAYLEVRFAPFVLHGSSERRCLVATFEDVTERALAEKAMQAKVDQLLRSQHLLENLASTDGLTGLANSRHLGSSLSRMFDRAQRDRSPLSLAVLDIDFFKTYNDHFGHPRGDEVLREMALILRTHTRPTDFVARYGGEEFVIILPATTADDALTVVERIRSAIEQHPWTLGPVTASFGVVSNADAYDSAERLLQAADRALVHSKMMGRNRVTRVIGPWEPDGGASPSPQAD